MKSFLPITIRFKELEDEPYIYSSWIKNMSVNIPHSYCSKKLFCQNKSLQIKNIFTISTTLIAALTEDPDIILGYLTYSFLPPNYNLIIHNGHVKGKYRKNYIMHDLLSVADPQWQDKLIGITQYTHDTFGIFAKKYKLTYDPYVIDLLLQLKEKEL